MPNERELSVVRQDLSISSTPPRGARSTLRTRTQRAQECLIVARQRMQCGRELVSPSRHRFRHAGIQAAAGPLILSRPEQPAIATRYERETERGESACNNYMALLHQFAHGG